jgi:hypothetical protein
VKDKPFILVVEDPARITGFFNPQKTIDLFPGRRYAGFGKLHDLGCVLSQF